MQTPKGAQKSGVFAVKGRKNPQVPQAPGRREINAGASARPPAPEDLLFFDLETTGLSGGAGTVAFLAAFGRPVRRGRNIPRRHELRITQYLLLDYPGEYDFLEALLGEFVIRPPLVVSYNGKSFDSQILKTRCLMNGIPAPEYLHADLLHPARRLWKRPLGDCSQAAIERGALGLDRSGDTPGALAPEIWFAFLRSGETAPLLGICDHNRRDITGLAGIFTAINQIAADPRGLVQKYNYDIENAALRWREAVRNCPRDTQADILRDTGKELLRYTAEQGFPGAALVYALDLLREGNYAEGRLRLSRIAAANFPVEIRARALRRLAIDSEWRLEDPAAALGLTSRGLELPLAGQSQREEFERRAERLCRKLARST
ncbi:MAG: ribonuclease H-like domain-containing protein [Treponema sp.]|nr:ribonuclease H-like domain-containing protein [Treponema sp.]